MKKGKSPIKKYGGGKGSRLKYARWVGGKRAPMGTFYPLRKPLAQMAADSDSIDTVILLYYIQMSRSVNSSKKCYDGILKTFIGLPRSNILRNPHLRAKDKNAQLYIRSQSRRIREFQET